MMKDPLALISKPVEKAIRRRRKGKHKHKKSVDHKESQTDMLDQQQPPLHSYPDNDNRRVSGPTTNLIADNQEPTQEVQCDFRRDLCHDISETDRQYSDKYGLYNQMEESKAYPNLNLVCSSSIAHMPPSYRHVHPVLMTDGNNRELLRQEREQESDIEMKLREDIKGLLTEQQALQNALGCEKQSHAATKANLEILEDKFQKHTEHCKDSIRSLELQIQHLQNELQRSSTGNNSRNVQIEEAHAARYEAKHDMQLSQQVLADDTDSKVFVKRSNASPSKFTVQLLPQIIDEVQNIPIAEVEEDTKEIIRENIFSCIICENDEVSCEDTFDLEHDDHKLCRECARELVQNSLNNRTMYVRCPHPECSQYISEEKCFEVLSCEEQTTWLEVSLTPRNDPGFRQCPVPGCVGFDLKDDEVETDCICLICSYQWSLPGPSR
mmetsp:Transcript_22140/g.32236  ORF Transcript_22140/g.32236 Transcript_22140/m.32236 type:complete len:438 (+) Transcript_22140:78-1391(+)